MYDKGVALLKKQGIDVPTEPSCYPELQALYQDLQSRPEIDPNDVQTGMLIAYMYPSVGNPIVTMLKVGEVKTFIQDEIMIWAEPTDVSETYLKFEIDPKSNWANPSEKSRIGDMAVTETMAKEYPFGKTKIVAITENDMKKVKSLIPEKVDKSLERVHYNIMDTDLDALLVSDKPTKKKVKTVVQFAVYALREYPDQDKYRQACEFLVDNRDKLTSDVYICLPGGSSRNSDPAWVKVKRNSEIRCGCGNQRVIHPKMADEKREYLASDLGEVVVSPDKEVYLKPADGSQESTHVKLYIKGNGLAFMKEPFAPLVLTPDIFSVKGYNLEQLADILSEQDRPPVFMKSGKNRIPVFAINAVDLASKSVTITPDKAVESYQPAK